MIHLTRFASHKPQTMKKHCFSLYFLLPFFFILFYSCSKSNDVAAIDDAESGPSLHLLQSKWLLTSLKAYPSRNFSGMESIGVIGNGTDYYDINADGKIYAYALGVRDTAAYKLLKNDSTLLVYGYDHGMKAPFADTAIVIKITSDSLVWYHRNVAGDYAKFTFAK